VLAQLPAKQSAQNSNYNKRGKFHKAMKGVRKSFMHEMINFILMMSFLRLLIAAALARSGFLSCMKIVNNFNRKYMHHAGDSCDSDENFSPLLMQRCWVEESSANNTNALRCHYEI
jgi:hypothetical protein